jgi:histone H3/H4
MGTSGKDSQLTTSATPSKTSTKKKNTRKKGPKKKTPSGGVSSSTANTTAAVLTRKAKSLYEKLQQEKNAAFHDAAWLSTIPTQPHHPLNTYSPSFLEQDLDIVQNALKANGLSLSDVTAQSYGCLLEAARKFALELIDDAADYAMLSSTEEITPVDLQLALDMQKDYHVNSPESLDHLTQIADETNRSILPPIPDNCYNGIILPPPEHNLLGRTFDVVSRSIINAEQSAAAMKSKINNVNGAKNENSTGKSGTGTGAEVGAGTGNGNDDENGKTQTTKNKKKPAPSYGANRGPQIEIKFNSAES